MYSIGKAVRFSLFQFLYRKTLAKISDRANLTLDIYINLVNTFFQNSGTEANEAMIKMARKYGMGKYGPSRYNIVTAKDRTNKKSQKNKK